MNVVEEYMFNQHMKNIDDRFEDFSRECMSMQNSESLSIILSTDIHYIRKYALYIPSYYKLKEMVDFSGYIGADLLAVLGDIVDGNTTIKRQYRDMYDCIGLLKNSKTQSVLLAKGNHDSCEWFAYKNRLGEGNYLSAEDWYIHLINPLRVQYPMILDENNIAGGYYYIDCPLQKIRVINLNTSDTVAVLDNDGCLIREYCNQWRMGLSEKQLHWLEKALTFEEKGWSVVFMSHAFLKDIYNRGEVISNGDIAWNIIKAFKNKEKGMFENKEKYYEAKVEFDFTNNNSNDVLLYLFGHVHKDLCLEEDGITVVSTENIATNVMQWDEPSVVITGGWDFAVIDKKTRTFKTKRFGNDSKGRIIELL